jgi:DNA-binding transcriptional LysR family regulator
MARASVVSKRIAGIEVEFGTTLLRRVGRGVSPTEARLIAYERAAAVLPQVEALVEQVSARAGALRGSVGAPRHRDALHDFVPRLRHCRHRTRGAGRVLVYLADLAVRWARIHYDGPGIHLTRS